MTIEETRQKLQELLNKHIDSYSRKLKLPEYKELADAIAEYIPEPVRSDKYSSATKLYWLLHGLTEFPRCISCCRIMSDRQVRNILIGYTKCCSPQCARNSSQRKERYIKACRRKYGVDNISQLAEVKQKKADTTLKNYGVDNPGKSAVIQNQMKQTCREKYGVDYSTQTEQMKEKTTKTLLQRYGVEHPLQNHDIRLKAQSRYKYNSINFDSKPELAYYIWLVDNNIDFEYQPNKEFKYSYKGKDLVYAPDFIINGRYTEVKGRHFFKVNGEMQNPFCHSQDGIYEAKHQCMLKNDVEIILDNDNRILTALCYIESKYGKDYLKQFRNLDLANKKGN